MAATPKQMEGTINARLQEVEQNGYTEQEKIGKKLDKVHTRLEKKRKSEKGKRKKKLEEEKVSKMQN